ncbi:fimbrial-like adhesin protein [Escherichia coli O145:H28]|nr:fimbrial-like adhesin protein [Escherichia coli O145:H28]
MTDFRGKTSIFSHPVYLFLRKFSLQDSRGGSVRVAFNGIEDAENNTLLKLDEGSNTASGLGIEILDGNMRPVKLNDLHAGMQWLPLVPEQNNILPYSARLKSTQKSVNPGLVRASATFTLEFQ